MTSNRTNHIKAFKLFWKIFCVFNVKKEILHVHLNPFQQTNLEHVKDSSKRGGGVFNAFNFNCFTIKTHT